MANQPEQNSFDPGVYQWEKGDPVLGGAGNVANAPLLSLANRTRYLYNQVLAILVQLGLLAPKNSPTFTGTITHQGGAFEIGPTTGASTPYLDFHSSGSTNDYDSRIIANGGTPGTSGQGALSVIANAGTTFSGAVQVATTASVRVGSLKAGDNAALYANLPTGYGSYVVQARVGGVQVLALDQSGNGTFGGTVTAGLDVVAGRNLVATGTLTTGGQITVGGTLIELGNVAWNGSGTQPAAALDLHTGSSSNNYDVRLLASAGVNGTNGGGIFDILAAIAHAPQPPSLDASGKIATTQWAGGTLTQTASRSCMTFPNGLMIQWGNDNFLNSTTSVQTLGQGNTFNFLQPFPTKCFGVHLQEASAGGWDSSASPGGPAPTLYGVRFVNQVGFSGSVVGFSTNGSGVLSARYVSSAGFFFIAIGN